MRAKEHGNNWIDSHRTRVRNTYIPRERESERERRVRFFGLYCHDWVFSIEERIRVQRIMSGQWQKQKKRELSDLKGDQRTLRTECEIFVLSTVCMFLSLLIFWREREKKKKQFFLI